MKLRSSGRARAGEPQPLGPALPHAKKPQSRHNRRRGLSRHHLVCWRFSAGARSTRNVGFGVQFSGLDGLDKVARTGRQASHDHPLDPRRSFPHSHGWSSSPRPLADTAIAVSF